MRLLTAADRGPCGGRRPPSPAGAVACRTTDAALRALADHAEKDADSVLGLNVALTGGHIIRGTLVPNGDLHPLARRKILDLITHQQLGRGRAGLAGGQAAADALDATAAPVWAALDAEPGPDTLTFAGATLYGPGANGLGLPVVRVDGTQVTAWWLVADDPA